MPRLSSKIILQRIYECFCIVFTIMLQSRLKEGIGFIPSGIIFLFLIVYFGSDLQAHKIAFAISFVLLAYLAWTELITFHLTYFLEKRHYIQEEHSLWIPFALLLPFLFSIITFLWVLKKRRQEKKFDLVYLLASALVLFISAWIQ